MPWWLQGGFAPVDRRGGEHHPRGRRRAAARAQRPLRPQRLEPAHGGVAPLVPRRRDGARPPPRGRAGRLVRQPLRPHAALRGVVRVRRGRARRRGVAEQRLGDLARRQAADLGRGRATPTSCRPTTSRTRRRLRLRRPADHVDDGPPEDRSGHGPDALLRLRVRAAVPHVPRGRRRRHPRSRAPRCRCRGRR